MQTTDPSTTRLDTPRHGDTVRLSPTQTGTVIAVCTTAHGPSEFLIRHTDADGEITDDWLPRAAIREITHVENSSFPQCHHQVGDTCLLTRADITAAIDAVIHSTEALPSYQIHYIDATGHFVTTWVSQPELAPLPVRVRTAFDTARPSVTLPTLADGEINAGIVLDDTGRPTHFLILLPQQPDAVRLTWDDAMQWAASIGAELPTRQESAILFANSWRAFNGDWHWTSEQCADNASCAWVYFFDNGGQFYYAKGIKGRARAIRRVPLTLI